MDLALHSPPLSQKTPVTDTPHGVEIQDPYRWLEESHSPETRKWIEQQSARKRWDVQVMLLKFVFALLIYDLFRFGNSLERIQRLLLRWKVSNRPPQPEVVQQACRALRYARVWYPKRVHCLQRSAVLVCMLRSYGLTAHMVIGSQKVPFKAHAWVEVEGKVINERSSVKMFDVWDRF